MLTGALARAAGENVGSYAIGQGTLAANANYTIAFTPGTLTIAPASLSVIANNQSKIYGAADPALTFTASGFKFADNAAGADAARWPAPPAKTSAITRSARAHWRPTPTTRSPSPRRAGINPATLSVVAANQSKTYGALDPALTFTATGFQFAGLSTDDRRSVLTAARWPAPPAKTSATTRSARAHWRPTPTTRSPSPRGRCGSTRRCSRHRRQPGQDLRRRRSRADLYGNRLPVRRQCRHGADGRAGRAPPAKTSATTRSARAHWPPTPTTRSPSPRGRCGSTRRRSQRHRRQPGQDLRRRRSRADLYGNRLPVRRHRRQGARRGALGRAAGENVGNYAIGQGTLAANANYTIAFTPGTLAIDPATLSVIAANQGKTYGAVDPR